MKLISSSEIIIKKSRFLGYLYEIKSIDEIKAILDDLRKVNKKLRHIPHAYKLGSISYKTDDKEPHNTAGIQILNVLDRNDLNNHLLVVVRYYGGVKLGASNLLRAYSKCANLCIKK